MNHPYYETNVEQAMRVAAGIANPKNPKDTKLSIDRAIDAIETGRKFCGFNWITGRVCHELLLAYREALPIIRKGLPQELPDKETEIPTFSSEGNYNPEELCAIEEIRRKYCKP